MITAYLFGTRHELAMLDLVSKRVDGTGREPASLPAGTGQSVRPALAGTWRTVRGRNCFYNFKRRPQPGFGRPAYTCRRRPADVSRASQGALRETIRSVQTRSSRPPARSPVRVEGGQPVCLVRGQPRNRLPRRGRPA